jgi:hypothetical protein
VCEERLRLLAVYETAVEQFALRTADLKAVVHASPPEFEKLYEETRQCSDEVQAARLALSEHRQKHGC